MRFIFVDQIRFLRQLVDGSGNLKFTQWESKSARTHAMESLQRDANGERVLRAGMLLEHTSSLEAHAGDVPMVARSLANLHLLAGWHRCTFTEDVRVASVDFCQRCNRLGPQSVRVHASGVQSLPVDCRVLLLSPRGLSCVALQFSEQARVVLGFGFRGV